MYFVVMTWHCRMSLSSCPAATNHVIMFYHLLSPALKTKSTACILNLVLPCGHSLIFANATNWEYCNWSASSLYILTLGVTNIFRTLATSNICHFFCSNRNARNAAKMNGFYRLLCNCTATKNDNFN